MTTTPQHLCPVIEHPELCDLDDTGVRLWADSHNLELHRDWRGLLCTTLEDAYTLRGILDADNLRQAQAVNEQWAQAEAESEARLAPLRTRLAEQRRLHEAHAAIDAGIDPATKDPRFREWDRRASEKGAALFESFPAAPEPDNRTLIERLEAKRGAR